MRRATHHHPAGSWSTAESVATVTLPFDERHRRRVRLTDDAGQPFLLDLDRPARLAEGDGLALEGGGFITVRAAEEAVFDIRCIGAGHAARVAWHIGNRHAPLQVLPSGRLRILADHVLRDMVEGLGATVTEVRAPFQPEAGAYVDASGHHYHHAHGHHHGHGGNAA